MKNLKLFLITIGMLGFAAGACVPAPSGGAVRQSSEGVSLHDADMVKAEILMGAGELEVKGGADQLLEAEFRYSDKDLLPDISYRVGAGSIGSLQIEQGEKPGNHFPDSYYNQWILRFNNEVPLDLTLTLGAGDCSMDLEDLNLQSLTMTMGVGEANLDLGSALEQDLVVDIQGGMGQLNVNLPADVNIKAEISGGLGEVNLSGLHGENGIYVSDFQGSGPVIRVHIQAGIGELNLLAR